MEVSGFKTHFCRQSLLVTAKSWVLVAVCVKLSANAAKIGSLDIVLKLNH